MKLQTCFREPFSPYPDLWANKELCLLFQSPLFRVSTVLYHLLNTMSQVDKLRIENAQLRRAIEENGMIIHNEEGKDNSYDGAQSPQR